MTNCQQCAHNKTKHGHHRPLFNLTLPLLKIAAQGARDEVRHELSHRSSVGARNLLQELGGPAKKPNYFDRPRPDPSHSDEETLRGHWFKNQLYMQRIHDKPGAADFISRTRRTNEAIELEWARRREMPNDTGYWRETTVRIIGSGTGPDNGMLSALGYRVTNTARLTDDQRHWLLDAIIAAELPPVADREYVAAWGSPLSATRLEKMLHCLRGLASMALNIPAMHRARSRWLEDAAYLERTWAIRGHF
jgi:hypothetical protein